MAVFLRDLYDRGEALAARAALAGLAALPERSGLRFGALAGRAMGRLARSRRDIALRNLRIAFPLWSEEARRSVAREFFANLGRSAVEIARFRRQPPEHMRELTRFEHMERLEEAHRRSPTGGVVVITGHFGNWELLASGVAAWGLPVTLVHRARSNPHMERLISEWREHGGLDIVRRGDAARVVIRALREGRIVALPIDQNVGRHEGVFVPFFSRMACTRDGPARIAMRLEVPVVPVFIYREGDGRHVIRVDEPLEMVPAPTREAREAAIRENVARMTRAMERAVRRGPAEWAWPHRRWKGQPPGEPRPYPSRRRGSRARRQRVLPLGIRAR